MLVKADLLSMVATLTFGQKSNRQSRVRGEVQCADDLAGAAVVREREHGTMERWCLSAGGIRWARHYGRVRRRFERCLPCAAQKIGIRSFTFERQNVGAFPRCLGVPNGRREGWQAVQSSVLAPDVDIDHESCLETSSENCQFNELKEQRSATGGTAPAP